MYKSSEQIFSHMSTVPLLLFWSEIACWLCWRCRGSYMVRGAGGPRPSSQRSDPTAPKQKNLLSVIGHLGWKFGDYM